MSSRPTWGRNYTIVVLYCPTRVAFKSAVTLSHLLPSEWMSFQITLEGDYPIRIGVKVNKMNRFKQHGRKSNHFQILDRSIQQIKIEYDISYIY